MSKPRILDLFCGAGGAAMGYSRAGFEVVGVDHHPQPRYPFEFRVDDALAFLWRVVVEGRGGWGEFDAIHASPPCQRYSTATKRNGTELDHPDLIGPTRELLEQTGLPYVIENVVGAPLKRPYTFCGAWFNLNTDGYRLRRHRLFETSFALEHPPWCRCATDHRPVMDITGGGPTHKPRTDGKGGRPYKGTAAQARRIMGIDWMTKAELNEAIPPVYTAYLGVYLYRHIHAQRAAA